MNSSPIIVALVVGIVGPLGVYIGTVRRLSGRVGTSEAGQLWEESRSIREWATARITELNSVVERLEQKVKDLEDKNERLDVENGRLTRILEGQEETIAELRSQVHRLSNENERLQKENITLRSRVSELEANHE